VIIVTDTHPWVWFLTGNPHLSTKAKSSLSASSNLIVVPSIVMLEIKYLYDRKRISISFDEVVEKAETSENVVIHPLDIFVATFAPVKLEIHDAIIVGTAINLSQQHDEPVSLVTRDETITKSGLVPIIW
jgi:PIN domain nuclease of toxin-antitoxin system